MDPRPPKDDDDLRRWLQNMIWHHHYSDEEIRDATGFSYEEVLRARSGFNITVNNRPERPSGSALLVLPYPGSRHPRIQDQTAAPDPRRDTQLSLFAPWDATSYLMVDLPEALSSPAGLLYLSHGGAPTVWSRRGVRLPPVEWTSGTEGRLEVERVLPDGVAFGARATPVADLARLEFWVRNDTSAPLASLTARIGLFFRGATGFEAQSSENKRLTPPHASCRSSDGRRWILSGWQGCRRITDQPLHPAIYVEAALPDCAPGATVRLRGWVAFYEGTDPAAETARLDRQEGLP